MNRRRARIIRPAPQEEWHQRIDLPPSGSMSCEAARLPKARLIPSAGEEKNRGDYEDYSKQQRWRLALLPQPKPLPLFLRFDAFALVPPGFLHSFLLFCYQITPVNAHLSAVGGVGKADVDFDKIVSTVETPCSRIKTCPCAP